MKTFYTLALLILTSLAGYSQLLNGGFEDWTTTPGFADPDTGSDVFFSSNFESFFSDGIESSFEVSGNPGSALHIETVDLQDGTSGGFAIWGTPPEGEDLIFSGGFDFSDSEATGITCDLRYSINPDSPGLLIVQFLFEGVPTGGGTLGDGTYLFPFSGEQLAWTTETFTFLPPIGAIVDECVIGFACNNLIDDNATSYPGDFLEVDNLSFMGSTSTIPAGDFDDPWVSQLPTTNPDNWQGVDIPGFDLIEQSDDAFEGDYALKLNSLASGEGDDIIAAIGAQGTITEEGIFPTIPTGAGFYGISFQYKLESMMADTGIVAMSFSANPNPTPEEINFFEVRLLPAIGIYTEVVIDLSEVVDFLDLNYASVAFAVGFEPPFAQDGSSLFIDDVQFLNEGDNCEFVALIEQGNNLILCPAESEVISVSDGYDNYQWYAQPSWGGDPEIIDGANGNTFLVDAENFAAYDLFCEVTLDGCTENSSSILIDGWVFLPTSIISEVTEICEGESTTLEATGATGTITWFLDGVELLNEFNPTIVVSEPGTYTASISPFECPDTDLNSGVGPTITVNPLPVPAIDQDANTLTTGDFAIYQWYLDGDLIEGATNMTHEASEDGNYTVSVTDVNGCSGSSEGIDIIIQSVGELFADGFTIYPNPSSGEITINSGSQAKFFLRDISGKTLKSGRLDTIDIISLDGLESGIYLITVEAITQRFILE